MPLRLFNSLTRRVEDFSPIDPGCPTMYLCGPTVYNYVHVGNARGPVVFGVLAALLRRRYGALRYARNITDVDDKINAAARDAGVPISAIADRFAAAYREDMAALGVDGDFSPDLEPAATAHIAQMIAMIGRLVESGHAYAAEGHVLFAVDTFPGYGKLSRRDPEEMLAGARVEVAPYKRNAGDFVLWKPSPDVPGAGPGQALPGWDSPWGRGRPGWHIECSAIARHHLGATIDVQGGGSDLVFPHHEMSASHAHVVAGAFASLYAHAGMVALDGEKMSKSLGNLVFVSGLRADGAEPAAVRLALLAAHYRADREWTPSVLSEAVERLTRWRTSVAAGAGAPAEPVLAEVRERLADDLDAPGALAAIDRWTTTPGTDPAAPALVAATADALLGVSL